MARVGAALTLSIAAAAAAQDQYQVREDAAETGTSIVRPAVMWPVAINRKYEDLTAEERNIVRGDYVRLGAGDEPPYPRDGMASILRDVARIQAQDMSSGFVHIAVRVDASGHARGIGVLSSPSQSLEEAVAIALLNTEYKPGTCDGKPCDSDYSFKYRFELARHHTARSYWNPALWTPTPAGARY